MSILFKIVSNAFFATMLNLKNFFKVAQILQFYVKLRIKIVQHGRLLWLTMIAIDGRLRKTSCELVEYKQTESLFEVKYYQLIETECCYQPSKTVYYWKKCFHESGLKKCKMKVFRIFGENKMVPLFIRVILCRTYSTKQMNLTEVNISWHKKRYLHLSLIINPSLFDILVQL